jgi:hypothetical protein
VTAGPGLEDAGRSQPKVPVPVVNGTGPNGQMLAARPKRAATRPFPELTREHSDMQEL